LKLQRLAVVQPAHAAIFLCQNGLLVGPAAATTMKSETAACTSLLHETDDAQLLRKTATAAECPLQTQSIPYA
jgi:hypothetical protein